MTQRVFQLRHRAILVLAVAALVLTAVISIHGTGASAAPHKMKLPKHWVIGSDLPLTGPAAAYGASMERGVLLAVDEVNSSGGIDGRSLIINSQDATGEDSSVGVTQYNENVAAGAFAVNDCFLQNGAAQAAQAKKKGHVPVTSGCLEDNALVGLPWFYNTVPTVDQEIQVLLNYAHSKGINNVAAIIDQSNYDATPAQFSADWKATGSTGTATAIEIPPGTTDPTPMIAQALANPYQGVVVLAVGTLGQTVLTDLASQGVSAPLFGNISVSGYTSTVIQNKQNMCYTNSVVNTTKAWNTLQEKYFPGVTPLLWDNSFYTSTMIMVEALKTAIKDGYGDNGAAVERVLENPKSKFSGAGGTFIFGKGHTAPGVFQVLCSSAGSAFAVVSTVKAG